MKQPNSCKTIIIPNHTEAFLRVPVGPLHARVSLYQCTATDMRLWTAGRTAFPYTMHNGRAPYAYYTGLFVYLLTTRSCFSCR